MGLKACLKKEFLEAIREKKSWTCVGICVMISFLAIFYVVIMQFLKDYINIDGEIGEEIAILFDKSYYSGAMFYISFAVLYIALIEIYLYSNSISKEISQKQWVLPINAGVKPKNMIFAKIISAIVTVFISFMIGSIINFIFVVSYCEPNGVAIWQLLLTYFCVLITLEFYVVITITLNAITKKRWIAIVVPIIIMLLLESVLSNIVLSVVDGTTITLCDYTPLLFSTAGSNYFWFGYPWQCWLSACLTTVVILGGLIVGAVLSNKIKPEKTRKKS